MNDSRLTGRVDVARISLEASRAELAAAVALGTVTLALFLVLFLAQDASASTLKDVVPKSGTIAGQPYSSWMTRTWKLYYSSLAPEARACKTVTVKGRAVTLVGNFKGGRKSRSACNVPAHSAIYVNAYTTHCATLPGEHRGFPSSVSELRKCSLGVKKLTVRVGINAWLDNRQVSKFGHNFWMGTPVFSVGVKGRQVQAAAWGWSLLLKPLPKGAHTVRIQVKTPNKKPLTESRITLHVR